MSNNYIDSSGLHLQQLSDIVEELETGFKSIYGEDINLEANSPDGQMINLFAQAKLDILDLIQSVYNSFSPSSAAGSVLDQRCALNGIIRQEATNTTVNILLTTDRIVPLTGVNDGIGTPFTVEDPSGNQFYLINGTTGASGPNTLLFTAAESGKIEVGANTITTIVTPVLGVLSVNNPSSAVTIGQDEETDASLRQRRYRSVAIPSEGYLDGLEGSLLTIPNVKYSLVIENFTNATGPTSTGSIPPHSIWTIVDYAIGSTGATGATGASGITGAELEIAQQIYNKKTAGCGMTGSITVNLTQTNGIDTYVKYSYANYQYLYINVTLLSLNADHTIDDEWLKSQLVSNIEYEINETADFTKIISLIKSLDPYIVVTSGGIGDTGPTGATYSYLSTQNVNDRWILQESNISTVVV